MAKRDIPEINAGSMADIAFLLLIFWLVTTTMERDNGVYQRLSQKAPPCEVCPKVKERNILNIIVNENNMLLIEGEGKEVADVEQYVVDFYTSEAPNFPERAQVTKATISDTLSKLEARRQVEAADPNPGSAAAKLVVTDGYISEWKAKEEAHELLGDFMSMNKRSVIRLEVSSKTSYVTYLGILDNIKSVIREYRDNLSLSKFGTTFTDMEIQYNAAELIQDGETMQELIPKIEALRIVYPESILEPDAKN